MNERRFHLAPACSFGTISPCVQRLRCDSEEAGDNASPCYMYVANFTSLASGHELPGDVHVASFTIFNSKSRRSTDGRSEHRRPPRSNCFSTMCSARSCCSLLLNPTRVFPEGKKACSTCSVPAHPGHGKGGLDIGCMDAYWMRSHNSTSNLIKN